MLVSVDKALGTVEWIGLFVLTLLVFAIVDYFVLLWAGAFD